MSSSLSMTAKRVNRIIKLQGQEVASPLMPFVLSTFSTAQKWMGLLGQEGRLIAAFAGHASQTSIVDAARRTGNTIKQADWNVDLRQLLEAYADGEVVDFRSVDLCLPPLTPFQQGIVTVTRMLAYGQTASYGDLAFKAGYPRAARAVGTIMAKNRLPILIPCHRVLAAGGKLGGYGCPLGTKFKKRLLDMEAQHA